MSLTPELRVHDEGHLHHLQAELSAQALLDVALDRVDRLLGLPGRQQRVVVGREDPVDLVVAADPRAREVRTLRDVCHGCLPLVWVDLGCVRGPALSLLLGDPPRIVSMATFARPGPAPQVLGSAPSQGVP